MWTLTYLIRFGEHTHPSAETLSYQITDRLHGGRTAHVSPDGIAHTVAAWLSELGVCGPLVEDLPQAVRSGDWPSAHALAEHLAVDVAVAAQAWASSCETATNLVVSMPISLRTTEDPLGGNRATLMRFDVPSGDMDAAERVRVVHERTAKARNEKSLSQTRLIPGALNAIPSTYVGSALRHVDFVASDVPGFLAPLYFAGVPMSMPFAFSPTIGAAVNITLLT